MFHQNRTNALVASLETPIETAQIHDIVQVTEDIFHVTANFNVTSDFTTKQKFRIALAESLGRNAVPIEASFKEISSKHKFAVAGYVSTHPQAIELDDTVLASGRFISTASAGANVMIDSQDESLWEVSTAGDKKYLVRHGEEDLSELVALASTQNLKIRSQGSQVLSAAIMLPHFQKSDFVTFVDSETASVRFGVVVGTVEEEYKDADTGEIETVEELEVIDLHDPDMQLATVSPYLVVTAATVDISEIAEKMQAKTKVQAANVETASNQELIDYFREVFKYAPSYFAQLEAQITEHTAM